jgi:hypothetical protein
MMDYMQILEQMREIQAQTDMEADAIFGNLEDLPEDEGELIFSPEFSALTFPEKLQAITELRAKKGVLAN